MDQSQLDHLLSNRGKMGDGGADIVFLLKSKDGLLGGFGLLLTEALLELILVGLAAKVVDEDGVGYGEQLRIEREVFPEGVAVLPKPDEGLLSEVLSSVVRSMPFQEVAEDFFVRVVVGVFEDSVVSFF